MKKIRAIIFVLVIIVIILLIVLLNNKKEENKEINNIISNTAEEEVISTKKLMSYLDILNGNYYMKYITQIENTEGELEDCTVEICVKDDDIAMNSDEQNLSVVKKNNKLYYIMHDSKTVIINSVKSGTSYDIDSYKLTISKKTIDNSFITTGMQKVDEVDYYYEEYSANDGNDTKLRYYFDGDTLKFIKTISSDGTETLLKIEELSKKTYDTMFDIPSDYTQNDLS